MSSIYQGAVPTATQARKLGFVVGDCALQIGDLVQ
jgi:hypothetical protein